MTTLCTKCGITCDEEEYTIHIINDCQSVKCPNCPKHFANAEAVLRHTRAVHDLEFTCSICQAHYCSKFNLERHLAFAHKLINHEKHKCEQCGEIFSTKYYLKVHILTIHNNGLTCEFCGQKFISFTSIKRHKQKKHKDEMAGILVRRLAKVKCPKCTRFIAKPALDRHIRMKHTEKPKTFQCYVCDKGCATEKALQKHINSRHAEENSVQALLRKKYKCSECPLRFSSNSTLLQHIRSKHEEQYKCEICEILLSSPFALVRHKSRVHGIEPEETVDVKKECSEDDTTSTVKPEVEDAEVKIKKFQCKICLQRFTKKWNVKTHMQAKHSEIEIEEEEEVWPETKKFKCPKCPLRYTYNWTLQLHIKGKHEGKIKCDLCGKCFSAPFPLARHKANVHGMKDELKTQPKPKAPLVQCELKNETEENVGDPLSSQSIKIKEERK